MTVLALEFSSAQRSVAVARAGRVLAGADEIGGRATNAFALIEKVLAAAGIGRGEIECLAVGLGPGSYAGIRVALSLAQGWQLATGVKLFGVGSAETLAAQAQAEKMFGRVNVVIDAQRGEFYLATFDVSVAGVKQVTPLKIAAVAEVASHASAGEILTGPEVSRWLPAGKIMFPSATMLAQRWASAAVIDAPLEPIYLRAASFIKSPPPRVLPP